MPARPSETWVVAETLKRGHNRSLAAELFFWRDNQGLAVAKAGCCR